MLQQLPPQLPERLLTATRQQLQKQASSSPSTSRKEAPREYTDTLKKKGGFGSWFGSGRKKKKKREALAAAKRNAGHT